MCSRSPWWSPISCALVCSYLGRWHARGAKRVTLHDAKDEILHAVPARLGVGDNATNGWLVVIFDAPAEAVRHQVLRERPDERHGTLEERALELDEIGNGSPVVQLTLGVEWRAVLANAPASRDVEIVERQPDRVHVLMTRLAGWIRAMQLHPLARREHTAFFRLARFIEERNAGRWRRRR